MLLTALINFLARTMLPSPQDTLDEYIASKNPQSQTDVEFWIAEYDNRQRQINRFLANGDAASASWYRMHT